MSIQNQIKKEDEIWTSTVIEDDPKQCTINLYNRIRYINEKYLNDNLLLDNWEVINAYDLSERLCLCGHVIDKGFIISNKSERCIIGSACIKRFMKEKEYKTVRKILRKTFDCYVCEKRCKKDENENPCDIGLCNDCDLCKFGKYKGKYWTHCLEENKQNVINYFKWMDENFNNNKLKRKNNRLLEVLLKLLNQ